VATVTLVFVAAPSTVRRTQSERRASTQAALLEATLQTLRELGYAKTTTTEIVARAGVSQGALFRYYPTKEALLSAAATALCASLFPRFRVAMQTKKKGADPIEQGIRGLWRVFKTDEVRVLHELYAAAPTEPGLKKALLPVLAAHRVQTLDVAKELFPGLALSPHFEAAADMVLATMTGAVLMLLGDTDRKREEAFLDSLVGSTRIALTIASE
jgi:AcrR family transcriptional regulator